MKIIREGFKKNMEFSRFSGLVGLKKPIFQKEKKYASKMHFWSFLAIMHYGTKNFLGGAWSHLYWCLICVKHNIYFFKASFLKLLSTWLN